MDKEKQSIERLQLVLRECNRFRTAVVSGLKQLPVDSLRRQVASLFIATMLDHYSSITYLLGEERYDFATSAFALVRPIIDSAFRGVWIANFATDEEINLSLTPTGYKVFEKVKPVMLYDLMKERFNIDDALQSHFKKDWQSVHGFVHTGTEQLKHRLEGVKSKAYPYERAIAALIMSSYYVMVGSAYVSVSTQNLDTGVSIVKAHDLLRSRVEIVRAGDKTKSHLVN